MDFGRKYQVNAILGLSLRKEDKNQQQNVQILTLHNVMKLAATLAIGALLLSVVGQPIPRQLDNSQTVKASQGYPALSKGRDLHATKDSRPEQGTTGGASPDNVQTNQANATVPSSVAFNPNDPTTWPTCGSDEFVRADTGLCAKKATAPVSTPATAPSPPSASQSVGSGDNYPCPSDIENAHGMTYVFCHESGGRRTVINSEGCVGIGQACPASKLYAVCPTLDLQCQIDYFTNYAASRYGGWSAAEAVWRVQRWW